MSKDQAAGKEPADLKVVISWSITFSDGSRIRIVVDAPPALAEVRDDQASDVYYLHLIDRVGVIEMLNRPGQEGAIPNPTRPPTDREVVGHALALLNAGISAAAVPAVLMEEFLISADRARELVEAAQRKGTRQARLDTLHLEQGDE